MLTENLRVVERAVTFACRRYRFPPEDAEEFASVVNMKLVENDYAIVRAWEGRSSFATFLGIVVQRMALDFRIHEWGKWHASSEAKRLGPLAVDLEQHLHRDGRTLDDAVALLASKHAGVTRASLEELADRLPQRTPRRRDVPIEEAEPVAIAGPRAVEEVVEEQERRAAAKKVAALLSAAFEKLPEDDRLILQLRFEQGMSLAQIARALGRDQKLLYRQVERRMREIRAELEASGVMSRDVADLIGRDESYFSLDFGNREPRPSKPDDEKEAAQSEES